MDIRLCTSCGESKPLTKEFFYELKCTNGVMFRRQRNNYPVGFRVLCWNCNCSIGMYGECPHQEEKRLLQDVSTNKSGEVINNAC